MFPLCLLEVVGHSEGLLVGESLAFAATFTQTPPYTTGLIPGGDFLHERSDSMMDGFGATDERYLQSALAASG